MPKFKFTRLLVLLLFFVSLSALPVSTLAEDQAKLLVLPLDDRPANTYIPEKIGQAGGIEIILPPSELVKNQPSLQTLDALTKWIKETSAEVDGFIISADMLTDAGLVNSRSSLQTTEDALNQLNVLQTIKNKYPNKPLYVYDTIQRLAPTVLKEGNLEQYNMVRDWAIAYDEVHNLGQLDKLHKLTELESKIGPDIIKEYFETRARNFAVNETLLAWTKQGYIDYLILGQDDANQTGLHRVEQDQLHAKINASGIQHKVSIFDGADEVDAVLISRFSAVQHNKKPSYKVHYIGVNGANWTSPFDHYTLQENIRKHIIAAGGTVATGVQPADIELYVNTPSTVKNTEIPHAIQSIKQQLASGKNVVVVDVEKVNRANAALADALIKDVGITNLLAYSAFNTAGNAIGLAVGQANARFIYINADEQEPKSVERAAHGQVELLLHAFSSDHLYRNAIEPKTKWYVNYIGGNEWDTSSKTPAILYFLKSEFHKQLDYLHDFVKEHEVISHKTNSELQTATIESFAVKNIHLPWNRLFEVSLEFDVKFKQ
ncbi:DUF4127 family protein [Bacillus sp. Marseille-P3661]|uniref:DUF4127 family protein n=1 Tax=Bacillus sp. Marseille-P3661 TaxID=1936234 RepID=UPI0015E1A1D0|nr:DUF4127 family protein [Bacillus sp. Marseille-P3661]